MKNSVIRRIASGLLVVSVVAACSDPGDDARRRAEEILVVATERLVESESYAVETRFAGRVEAPRQSDLGFELGGELATLAVNEGASVASGELLAKLDVQRLVTARAEATAALSQARAQAALAQSTLERTEEARGFDGVSAQELDQASQAVATAAAGEAAAAARLSRIDLDIKKSSLRAPYAGRVVRRFVDEGVIVAAGQPVFGLQERGPREVRIGVSSRVAQSLAPGSNHTLTIGGNAVEAQLRTIVPSRDPVTRTQDAIFVLDDSAAVPGDLARLTVADSVAERGFWLPLNALTEGNRGLWTVFVAEPASAEADMPPGASHRLSPRAIEVLHQNGSTLFARGAITDGELFVSDGVHRVVAGQYVRLQPVSRTGDVDVAEAN